MSSQSNLAVCSEINDSAMGCKPLAILSLFNCLSLDAVAVGLAWQCLFTNQFCQRWPQVYEIAILGLSIWLAYTADRLMDSRQLDRALPRTLRHEFHHRHHRRICLFWLIALVIDVGLVFYLATEAQLRIGVVAICLVLAYLAGIHFRPQRFSWQPSLPKEVQVGLVFAFGVSLNAWAFATEDAQASLVLAMLISAVMFSLNCLTVASAESSLDAQQGFPSAINRLPWSSQWLTPMMIAHSAIAMVFGVVNLIPMLIAICLSVSSVCLALALRYQRAIGEGGVTRMRFPQSTVSGLAADAATIVAPSVWLLSKFLP